ncbi:MAG TPA: PspA/IM30 family protein [Mycobacteriales bacterium]|nr:PspA/IM30 family protein [Mycobacteriales bacterium]
MFELLRRGWSYFVAALSGKLDERADPKIQIEQAITEAKRQHELLSQQAAAVLGNRHQLEMKLDKQMDQVEQMQGSARQAVVLAEQARAAGDTAKAAEYDSAAQSFATQLVAAEKALEDLKHLHDQALQASEKAKQAVQQNAMLLQQRLAERTKLLNQLDQAKMQERVNDALKSVSQLAVPGNTPSLDQVAEKIEARYARAMGASELQETSVESRMLEVQRSALDVEGQQRLQAIRASMGLTPAATATPAAAETPAEAPATESKPARARSKSTP